MPAGPGPLERTRDEIIATQAAGDRLRRLGRHGSPYARMPVVRRLQSRGEPVPISEGVEAGWWALQEALERSTTRDARLTSTAAAVRASGAARVRAAAAALGSSGTATASSPRATPRRR
jgi:hypothetical protein